MIPYCKQAKGVIFAVYFYFAILLWADAQEENRFSYKFEDYRESDGRIQVLAHYAEWDLGLTPALRVKITGLTDAISGASPNGLLPEDANDPLPRGTLPNEVRKSLVTNFSYQINRTRALSLEWSYSKEPDYIARGFAVSGTEEFNNRNTTLTLGLSHLNDTVKSSPVSTDKRSWDGLVGITHILDRNSILTWNVGAGIGSGYLGDPYKVIGRREINEIPLPGGLPPIIIDRILAYNESRPDRREKLVTYLEYKRYVDSAAASWTVNYRYFQDDWSIRSHTLQGEWVQKIGEHFVLSPRVRLYRQSAADFYFVSLNDTGIEPTQLPNGKGPHYSADYRLSSLDTINYGLKLTWFPVEGLTVDFAYDIYDMQGRDNQTRAEAYPKARIYTLGASYAF